MCLVRGGETPTYDFPPTPIDATPLYAPCLLWT